MTTVLAPKKIHPAVTTSPWSLVYVGWDPEEEPLREALCTLGNGYFATRGAAEESPADGIHYPATYLAGVYNRLTSEIHGRLLEHEELVNWPNWLCLSFRTEQSDWFELESVELLNYQQALDLQNGVLRRQISFRDRQGRQFTLISRRLVHMGNPHLAAIQWTLTAENWSGTLLLRTALDGSVTNAGVARYRSLANKHLEILETGEVGEDGLALRARTNQSWIIMGQAARTRVLGDAGLQAVPRENRTELQVAAQELLVPCREGQPIHVEKVAAIRTSRDWAISDPVLEATKAAERAGSFEQLLESHRRAWAQLWRRCDIQIGDSSREQCILRLHIFHLLQTISRNTVDRDVGVPARGWHGEAYRGHVFWDELFVFPYFNLRIPHLTRELLLYRYRRLDEARWAAKEAGYAGAMYPWQSGSDGREETPTIHLNPRSGRWVPDKTQRQRHVNAAIAYNIWQYFEATRDIRFLSFFGAEMMLEIARFFASLARYSPDRQRYEIHGVAGPDEFHTQYPDTDSFGVNNNAYTNVMASWTLSHACRAVAILPDDRQNELLDSLGITPDELRDWDHISRNLYVPFLKDGLISQFEGYQDLQELDWEAYRNRYGNIHRLDRILEAEGDDVNRYKVSKQADVLMLFYLFSAEELKELFDRLRYPFDPATIPDHIRYYMQRTSHGSTLSRVVHAWVLARSDRQGSWDLFQQALESDISDIQGGTTPEGIHLAAMAGTVDLAQRAYTGLELRNEVLRFNPQLPDHLSRIRMRIHYRNHGLHVCLTHQKLAIASEKSWARPIHIGFRDDVYELHPGETREFTL
jgi:alpha,alpha-trehalase